MIKSDKCDNLIKYILYIFFIGTKFTGSFEDPLPETLQESNIFILTQEHIRKVAWNCIMAILLMVRG